MNPYRLNFEFGGKRTEYNFASYSETQDVRPMTNALILKNDEAGIDGIQLTCSNRDYTNKRPKAELTVVTDVTSNICGTDKTLCAEGNVNVVGTGLVDDGRVIDSMMLVEEGFMGKCENGELTQDQCEKHANLLIRAQEEESEKDNKENGSDDKIAFEVVQEAGKPKGCYIQEMKIVFNSEGHENPAKGKLCPMAVTRENYANATDSAFAAQWVSERQYSRVSHDTHSNVVGQNLHYEFMCTNGIGHPPVRPKGRVHSKL